VPGVCDVDVYVQAGDLVRPLKSGSDRVAHVIVLGNDRLDVEAATAQACGMINIRTTKRNPK